jgi:enterochelin esterase-like enzyme
MPVAGRTSRAQLWLENLDDWSWPGRGEAAVEVLPPPWVPSFPLRREPAPARPTPPAACKPERGNWRRPIGGALFGVLAAIALALAFSGRLSFTHLRGAHAKYEPAIQARSAPAERQPLPKIESVSRAASGSLIDSASFDSPALHGKGSFLIYLPPGYAHATESYPVLYLLHGMDETDSSFLRLGVQSTLDSLIGAHLAAPVIAVMIQGGWGPNRWLHSYERYVLEVQRLVNRMLPTDPARDAQGLIGYSMGGYGAMHLALQDPEKFGLVESWEGFFNGLGGLLRADRPTLERLGLKAFIYGGEQDHVANPAENAPFAAALRSEGAEAQSAVYPGEHDFAIYEEHIRSMLAFATHALVTRPR